jgi:hypothetical protein
MASTICFSDIPVFFKRPICAGQTRDSPANDPLDVWIANADQLQGHGCTAQNIYLTFLPDWAIFRVCASLYLAWESFHGRLRAVNSW